MLDSSYPAGAPEHRIRGDERVACPIADIARRGRQAMLAIARLQPLEVDQLTGGELGQRLLGLQGLVGRKKAERTRATAVPGLHFERQIMELVDGAARARVGTKPRPTSVMLGC